MKIVVDRDLCEGHARCMEAAPDLFDIDDEDQMHVLDEQPDESHRDSVETAAANCPRQALTITE